MTPNHLSLSHNLRSALFLETPEYNGRWFLHTLPVLRAAHGLGGAAQPSLLPHPLLVSSLKQSWALSVHHNPHLPPPGVGRQLLLNFSFMWSMCIFKYNEIVFKRLIYNVLWNDMFYFY